MITILMTTYNGEKFLRPQLDSILNQSRTDFRLIIRDDCSTDGTYAILKEYQKKYSNISVLKRGKNSGNAKINFMEMITEYRDDYIFLADQDDIWCRDKIELTMARMNELEEICGDKKPILVHTDMVVVDSELNILSKSYREQVLHPNWKTFTKEMSLIMNIATGFTICYNRPLAEYFREIPKNMVMHDWWIFMVAMKFGVVNGLDNQTALYRQHGNNQLGTSNIGSFRARFSKLFKGKEIKQRFEDSFLQCNELCKMYNIYNKDYLDYGNLSGKSKLKKLRLYLRLGGPSCGLSRLIAAILFI